MMTNQRPFRSAQATADASFRGTAGCVLAHGSEGDVPVYANFASNGGIGGSVASAAAGVAGVATTEHGFSPYDFNGGTVAAVAGPDYAVIAADTRLSSGYEILSRKCSKLHALTPTAVLASSGCKTDVDQLRSLLDIKMKIYQHNHRKDMSSDSTAQMLSNTLYHKRFFPYYAFNLLAGVDANGVGAVYSYDAIGSFERTQYSANGSGQAYIIPVLDNVIGNRNRVTLNTTATTTTTDGGSGASASDAPSSTSTTTSNLPVALSSDEVVEIFKDTFLSAGERDIYTGDQVEIWVVTAGNVVHHSFALKKD